jgi:hypothetical protein
MGEGIAYTSDTNDSWMTKEDLIALVNKYEG